ncbi:MULTISPECIES: TauD/TfdA family dioxygenase [Escherichia]|uniref:TauD/TfdA family dioxygenase n=1 Tax=Escherichia TaxID=561 RepID=UPI000BE92450|nr:MULTISPECIES: TauD/TfdA family dioxygenase [Escherichia]MBB2458762.1 TauD/TfdA family dioxygenase [Escherichia coli]MBB7060100.1 TauD/TfdA family dioxygenase [Escherichia coli]
MGGWYYEVNAIADIIDDISVSASIDIARNYIPNINMIIDELEYGCGYYIIKNVPVDSIIPEPPSDGVRPYNKKYVSELSLAGITGALGYNVFSYAQEKKGAFFHDITPVCGKESTKSSNGTVDFSFHTDAAYLKRDIRPATLSLLCLNNDSKTATQIVSLNDVLKFLPESTINILKTNDFVISSPDSFDIHDEVRTSVLYEYNGLLEIQLSIEVTRALSCDAELALKHLLEAANATALNLMWNKGDFLIFNNRRSLHGRRTINGKRWLQRCYGSKSIRQYEIINLAEVW